MAAVGKSLCPFRKRRNECYRGPFRILRCTSNNADMRMTCIAYLAPEIPALTATFIHEELLGLERRSILIKPFSCAQAGSAGREPGLTALRTEVLYETFGAGLGARRHSSVAWLRQPHRHGLVLVGNSDGPRWACIG